MQGTFLKILAGPVATCSLLNYDLWRDKKRCYIKDLYKKYYSAYRIDTPLRFQIKL